MVVEKIPYVKHVLFDSMKSGLSANFISATNVNAENKNSAFANNLLWKNNFRSIEFVPHDRFFEVHALLCFVKHGLRFRLIPKQVFHKLANPPNSWIAVKSNHSF